MSRKKLHSDLPKFLRRELARGRVRYRVHLPTGRKVTLSHSFGSPEFWRDYAAAIAGELEPKSRPDYRPKPGTIAAAIIAYRCSAAFRDLEPSTQRVRARILGRLQDKVGAVELLCLEVRHVRAWRDAPSGPEAGNAIVKTLRQVLALAVEDGLLQRNVALDVKYRKSNNPSGHRPWTLQDVQQYAARHPSGTMAHTALALFLYTGQRLSDVRQLGPQHEQGGRLVFTQRKNARRRPVRMELPIVAPLRAAIDACPSGALAYLTSELGRPFASDKSFGNWFSKRCREAGLVGLSAHGLRKACGAMLADSGASAHGIMAALGHSTLKESARYTQSANRAALAAPALEHMADVLAARIVPQNGCSIPHAQKTVERKGG